MFRSHVIASRPPRINPRANYVVLRGGLPWSRSTKVQVSTGTGKPKSWNYSRR